MKAIVLISILIFASHNLFASKARLEALGQSNSGSYYLIDNRNIFLNPAHINNIQEGIDIEWGKTGGAGGGADTFASPTAEGGLFKKGKYNYGLYLGQENADIRAQRVAASATVLVPDNTITAFVGKNNWGASLNFSKNTGINTNEQSENLLMLSAGSLINKKLEAFGHLVLINKAKGTAANANDEYKGNLSYKFGAIYNYDDDQKIFGYLGNLSGDAAPFGAASTKIIYSSIGVGFSRVIKKNTEDMYFTSIGLDMSANETGATKTQLTTLPVVFGLESKVKSWLTLRSSIKQNVLLNQSKVTNTVATSIINSTQVAAGMSVKFNKVTLDSSFTTTGGTITSNNLMSRVSMNYLF